MSLGTEFEYGRNHDGGSRSLFGSRRVYKTLQTLPNLGATLSGNRSEESRAKDRDRVLIDCGREINDALL
jgi:hypothetical protein